MLHVLGVLSGPKPYQPCDEIRRHQKQRDPQQNREIEIRRQQEEPRQNRENAPKKSEERQNREEDLKSELENTRAEKNALQDAWKELERQFDEILKQKDAFRAKTDALEKELMKAKEEKASLATQLEAADIEIREKSKDLNRLESEKEKVMEASNLEKKQLQKKLTDLQGEFQIARFEIGIDTSENVHQREQHAVIEANYRSRLRDLVKALERERNDNQRYIDEMASLVQKNGDLCVRMSSTEEHLGEYRRDILRLQDLVQGYETKLKSSHEVQKKFSSEMRGSPDARSPDQSQKFKTEKEYYEKLYTDYKAKMKVETALKDEKIAEQEKMIAALQGELGAPKKVSCCGGSQDKKAKQAVSDLEKTLEKERAKRDELTATVKQLQEQLAEKNLPQGSPKETAVVEEAAAVSADPVESAAVPVLSQS